MARINLGVNLDDIESGYTTVPPGTYLLEVKSAKPTKSKSSSQPVIRWSYIVLEPSEFAGKVIPDSTSLKDEAMWKLKGLLEALEVGWDEEGFDPDDAIGKEFVGVITIEQYEGKDVNRVSEYHKVGELDPAISDEK